MAHHTLKCLPAHFEQVLNGNKKSEVRYNGDRGFQRGDTVTLEECQTSRDEEPVYSGRRVQLKITYVSNYMQKENIVVFCFEIVKGK